MSKGTIIGLDNLVYAILDDDPAPGGVASYEAPKALPGIIQANLNPNASHASLFADNGPYDTATALGEPTLSLNVADIPIDVQAQWFGHTLAGGVLVRKSSDTPPWLAIGYRALKSNGKFRYTWLAKGKFTLPEQQNKTKEASVAFQTPTATVSFVKRDCDDEWERHIDQDHIDFLPIMAANWFNNPYGGVADTVAPTVTAAVPVDGAVAVVVVGATVAWTFSEALALSTVHTGNFLVVRDVTGAGVAGTLSVNGARTQVTFTPTANLAAATAYRAIVTVGVKDLAGNALAAPDVKKFTTA